ncbi:MAG: hypothetical protein MZV49_15835 [Rhodopseudomonas palustris]|nr:hypothetical protein [Rhodopseudomonas palustris]
MLEVWRPGGRSDDRPRQDRQRHRHGQHGRGGAAAAGGEAGAEGGEAPTRASAKGGRRDRDRKPEFRRPRDEAGEGEGQKAARAIGSRARPQGLQGPKGGRQGREGREGGDRAPRVFSRCRSRRAERAADPNSPFAKLAALKEQLTATRKGIEFRRGPRAPRARNDCGDR